MSDALLGVEGLIDSAPSSGGGLGGLLGGAASAMSAGNLASLAEGFSKLEDTGMVGKFTPVVLSFLQNQEGDGLMSLVSKVLQND
ncbi:MAG: DUF2780 domain-containing protein [Candidatus Thiodiazotropha sp.]